MNLSRKFVAPLFVYSANKVSIKNDERRANDKFPQSIIYRFTASATRRKKKHTAVAVSIVKRAKIQPLYRKSINPVSRVDWYFQV